MAILTKISEAVQRFFENENRYNDLINGTGYTSTGGVAVPSVPNAIATLVAFNNRGAWVAARAYVLRDLVLVSATWYVCIVAHTSSAAFATDTASKWRVHQGLTGADLAAQAGAAMVGNAPAGTIVATTVQAALNELDADKAAKNGDGTQDFKVKSLNGGPLAGFRNRLMNAAMSVAQRSLPTGTGGYTLDRWFVNTAGAIPAVSRTTASVAVGNQYGARVMVIDGIAGNTDWNVEQRIEAVNSSDMAGQFVTLNYWLWQNTGTTRNIGMSISALSAFDNFAGAQVTQSSAPVAVPSGVWTNLTWTVQLPATAINGLRVNMATGFGTLLAGQQARFGLPQLELGTVSTLPEQRPYSVELALCQRYFQYLPAGLGVWANTTTYLNYAVGFAVPMRATPTATVLGTANVEEHGTAFRAISAVAGLNPTGMLGGLTTAAASAVGKLGGYVGNGTIALSAEL
jgi:hypothetical protein